MVLNKIPTFDEVKNWVNGNTVTSVNGETGAVAVENPITRQNRAETFEESDVTVTYNSTRVSEESIEMFGFKKGEDVLSRPTDNANYGSGQAGLVFTPNKDLPSGIAASLSSETSLGTAPFIQLKERSTDELLAEGVDRGDYYVFNASLTEGTEYLSTCSPDSAGAYEGQSAYEPLSNLPYSNDSISIISGYDSGEATENRVMAYNDLAPLETETTGSANIEWPNPAYVYEWDKATFQASPDGETVEVYVEESTDGGSTWTEIQGPISRVDPIQAAPDSRVRFRVELTRSDTSNNPTLDAIYRRWEV